MEQGSSGQPFYLNDSDSCTVDQLKTSDLRSLGDNVKLLAVIQNLSHDLVTKSENTYKKLDEIQRETEIKSVGVKNLINEFQMLADSQFIENRIYDADQTDSASEEPNKNIIEEENNKTPPDQKILPIIHECISNSLKFIDENFNLSDKLSKQPAGSDDEEDYVKETLARAVESNPFNKTPLPAIIGSQAFFSQNIFNDGENREVSEKGNNSDHFSDRKSSISSDSDGGDDEILFSPNKAISIHPGIIPPPPPLPNFKSFNNKDDDDDDDDDDPFPTQNVSPPKKPPIPVRQKSDNFSKLLENKNQNPLLDASESSSDDDLFTLPINTQKKNIEPKLSDLNVSLDDDNDDDNDNDDNDSDDLFKPPEIKPRGSVTSLVKPPEIRKTSSSPMNSVLSQLKSKIDTNILFDDEEDDDDLFSTEKNSHPKKQLIPEIKTTDSLPKLLDSKSLNNEKDKEDDDDDHDDDEDDPFTKEKISPPKKPSITVRQKSDNFPKVLENKSQNNSLLNLSESSSDDDLFSLPKNIQKKNIEPKLPDLNVPLDDDNEANEDNDNDDNDSDDLFKPPEIKPRSSVTSLVKPPEIKKTSSSPMNSVISQLKSKIGTNVLFNDEEEDDDDPFSTEKMLPPKEPSIPVSQKSDNLPKILENKSQNNSLRNVSESSSDDDLFTLPKNIQKKNIEPKLPDLHVPLDDDDDDDDVENDSDDLFKPPEIKPRSRVTSLVKHEKTIDKPNSPMNTSIKQLESKKNTNMLFDDEDDDDNDPFLVAKNSPLKEPSIPVVEKNDNSKSLDSLSKNNSHSQNVLFDDDDDSDDLFKPPKIKPRKSIKSAPKTQETSKPPPEPKDLTRKQPEITSNNIWNLDSDDDDDLFKITK